MPELQFPQNSYDTLISRIHRPVFLRKLAHDWGVVPANHGEEATLLELAGLLREANDNEQVKTAATGGNAFLTEAADSLKSAMSQLGYGEVPNSHDMLVKQAAQELSHDTEINQAVMNFGSYLGSQTVAQ